MANANKKIVQPKELPKRGTHSQVVAVTGGTLVFIAGMTSRSEVDARPVYAGDMRAQVRQVCENLGRALRSVGGEFSDIVKTTIFTTDVEEFRKANEVRYEYFRSDYPTGALIGVTRLAHPELMVEIEAMAVIPADRFKPVESLSLSRRAGLARPLAGRSRGHRRSCENCFYSLFQCLRNM